MKIKIVLFFTSVLLIFILLNSCIIINQPGKTEADDTSVKNNGGQSEEAKQNDDNGEEGTGSEIPDEAEGISEDDLSDLIRVFYPAPDQVITSPLLIEGEARGTWFFEASFPVRLLDGEGNVIAEHYAQTDQEWMTEDFISFTSQIEFNMPDSETGTLILMKDNPSDIREYDAQIEIQVRFR